MASLAFAAGVMITVSVIATIISGWKYLKEGKNKSFFFRVHTSLFTAIESLMSFYSNS